MELFCSMEKEIIFLRKKINKLFSLYKLKCELQIEEYEFETDYDNSYHSQCDLENIINIFSTVLKRLDTLIYNDMGIDFLYYYLCEIYSLDDLFPILSVGNSILLDANSISLDDLKLINDFVVGLYAYIFFFFYKIPLCIRLLRVEYEALNK